MTVAALRLVQDIKEIRGPNAFKTRLKCTCHEIALSVTGHTCAWNYPEERKRKYAKERKRAAFFVRIGNNQV